MNWLNGQSVKLPNRCVGVEGLNVSGNRDRMLQGWLLDEITTIPYDVP